MFRRLAVRRQAGMTGLRNFALARGALFLGLSGLKRGLGAVLGAAVRQEQAMAQVASRIRATGGAAGYGASELVKMASELQKVTTYGDEAILEMQSLLLSFRKLRRQGAALSSRFQVANRRVDYRSPIIITPFLNDTSIDTDSLAAFFEQAYKEAGIRPEGVDTGAVITTGDASRKDNAEAIVQKGLST